MTKVQLSVGEEINAGFGNFVPVVAEIEGKQFGCDAHLGTGKAFDPSATEAPSVELIDWCDGKGLSRHATTNEIWAAVRGAGFEVA